MKKVIYSPEVGSSKVVLGNDASLPEEHVNSMASYHSSVGKKSDSDQQGLKKLNNTIDALEKENNSLSSELSVLQKELESLKQDIANERARAKESGYEDAMSAAQTEIEKQVDIRVAAGEEVLNKIKSEVVASIYDNEGICLEIIYSAISRLIGDSAGSKDQIKEIVRLTMEKVASVDNLNICVSPHDYEMLKDDEFVTRNIIQSADVEYGGCIIKSGKGSVEAKLEDQLVKLKSLLLDIHKAK